MDLEREITCHCERVALCARSVFNFPRNVTIIRIASHRLRAGRRLGLNTSAASIRSRTRNLYVCDVLDVKLTFSGLLESDAIGRSGW
jgi:hypothetical protein